MFIFYRLLLAHVIADFPLQFTSIYRLKIKSLFGSFVHSGIFSLLAILLVWPYWNLGIIWEFIFFLWLVHGIQDWLKVVVCENFRLDNIWIFLLDQSLHMGFLGLLFPFGLAKLTPAVAVSRLVSLYNDNNIIIYGIVFISVGFGGGILISYIKNLFYETGKVDLIFPQKYIQVAERILIMGSVLLKGYYYLAIPGIWIIHGVTFKKRKKERSCFSSFFDLVLNTAIGVGIAIILKLT
jgi:hypothetical protein